MGIFEPQEQRFGRRRGIVLFNAVDPGIVGSIAVVLDDVQTIVRFEAAQSMTACDLHVFVGRTVGDLREVIIG